MNRTEMLAALMQRPTRINMNSAGPLSDPFRRSLSKKKRRKS